MPTETDESKPRVFTHCANCLPLKTPRDKSSKGCLLQQFSMLRRLLLLLVKICTLTISSHSSSGGLTWHFSWWFFLNVHPVIQRWESDTRIFRFLELEKALDIIPSNPIVVQMSKQAQRMLINGNPVSWLNTAMKITSPPPERVETPCKEAVSSKYRRKNQILWVTVP